MNRALPVRLVLEQLETRDCPSSPGEGINHAPIGAAITVATLEDTPYVFQASDFGFSDPNGSPANNFNAVKIANLPSAGGLTLNGQPLALNDFISVANINAGLFAFVTAQDANGTAYVSWEFQVQDDGGTENAGVDLDEIARPMMIDVTPVNDAPSLTGFDIVFSEDAGYVYLASWATFNPGGASDESGQIGTYFVVNVSNPALFDLWPAVDSSGALTLVLASDASGSSTFEIQVQDDGGTSNGGNDASEIQSFTITVNSINDAPSFTAEDPDFVDQNAGEVSVPNWASFLLGGGADEVVQTATYLVSNVSNTSLFGVLPAVSADGTLTYTVAPDVTGTCTFDVTVQDSGGTSNGGQDISATQSFTISVETGQDTPPLTITQLDRDGDRVIPARNTTLNLPGGSKRFSMRAGNQQVTLTISRTAGDTGSAFFDAARTQNTGNLAAHQAYTITIYGGDASSAARNMRLRATIGQNEVWVWDFTVFYVIPEPITTGTINETLPESVTNAGNERLRTLLSSATGTRGHQELGFRFFDDTDAAPKAYGAIIFRGKISPSGVNPADFRTGNRNEGFNWDRRFSGRGYLNDSIRADSSFNAENASDDFDDTDEDLTPAADLGGNELYIWVTDAPGFTPPGAVQDNETYRVRVNFNELAFYGGTQVSRSTQWNFRASATNPAGVERSFMRETTYAADNGLGVNEAISLTMNLAPSTIPNFTVTGFNPGNRPANGMQVNYAIQGTLLNSGGAAITQAYLIREISLSTSTVRYTIPLTITNRVAGSITGTFRPPLTVPQGVESNLGLYSLIVFIDGKAATLANAFNLVAVQ